MEKVPVSAVAAIGHGRVLGKDNDLLWKIPDDLKRFRQLTEHHPLILGRKTFDSILAIRSTPLPNRTNIVVSRDPDWQYEGVVATTSIEEALEYARSLGSDEIFIGGGAQIYEMALPYTDRLYMTLIDDAKEGDTFFPAYESEFTKVLNDETRTLDGLTYRWVDLERP